MKVMKRPDFFLLGFGLLFMAFFYGKVLWSPNDFMFSHTGDGIKNYFTFAYHIAHNSNSTNFEGMNYPFGESYLYTDCHPVLATAFRSIANFFPFVETHAVGLLNGFLLLSVFLTFFCTHLLLLELKFHRWFSVLFSITIAVLSPQLFRIDGHLALSYGVAIPLSWWLLLKCLQSGRSRVQHIYSVCILILNNLFWLFIHAYLGVIVLSFLMCTLLFHFIFTRKEERRRWLSVRLLLTICVPISLFLLHESTIDLHENRTDNPSGFFLHNAELDDIFIPHDRPIRPFLDRLTGNIIKQNWEARGYVGFPNTLLFVTGLLAGLLACFSRKVRQTLLRIFDHYWINISLLASILVLLFALAIPFRQFPDLLELFPILKQFRATGRFVWPFYFGFSVFSAYVFQRWVVALLHRSQIAGICFMGLLFLVAFAEGAMGHHHMSRSISSQKNVFLPKHLPLSLQTLLTQIDPEQYQAILSFPFFYNGSESFGRPRDEASVTNSLVLSYHTGLPCISTNLTRTSVTESKKIVQLLTPGYYDKIIQDDLTDDRPFLVVKTGTAFTAYEEAIIQRAHPIHAAEGIEILTLQKEALFHDESPTIKAWFEADSSLFVRRDHCLLSDTCSVFYHNGFEEQISPLPFEGLGGFHGPKKGKNELAVFAPHSFLKDHDYDISIWMHNGEKDALNLWFRLLIEEYDVPSNQWYRTTIFPEHAEVIDGNWSLVEGSFRVQDPQNPVYIVTRGKENSKANFNADELLIKDKGVQVFKQLDGERSLFYNNHRIR
jgi:hypothetical protein